MSGFKSFLGRHKKLWIILVVLILIYVAIPMAYRAMWPGRIFDLDAERVTSIELHDPYGVFVTVEDREEIHTLVEQLNSRRYVFWMFDLPMGQDSYGMTIHMGKQSRSYALEENWLEEGIILYTDMEFITDYFD